MKKRIFLSLLTIIAFFTITGCGSKKNEIKITEDSEILMTIMDNTLTNTGATLLFTNNSDDNYLFGDSYYLEKNKNGKWKTIKPLQEDIWFNAVGIQLNAHEQTDQTLNWKFTYGELETGKYRIIKDIFKESAKPVTEEDMIYIAVEFEIK